MNMLTSIFPVPVACLTHRDRLELAHRDACQVVDDLGAAISDVYAARKTLTERQRDMLRNLQSALVAAAHTRDTIAHAMEAQS